MPFIEKVTLVLEGVVEALPVAVVAIFGRDRLFRFVKRIRSRRWDRDPQRARRDGAFMAELLYSQVVTRGQAWYVHRAEGEKDEKYAIGDQRHHWRFGHVVEVGADSFTVRVKEHRKSRKFSLTAAAPRFSAMSASSRFSLTSASPRFSLSSGRLSRKSNASSGRLSRKSSAECNLVSVPMGFRNISSEAIMTLAHRLLRSIEWQHITQDLVASSSKYPDWQTITEHVPTGNTIDLFMSHSWHDDEYAKFSALEMVAATFQGQHKRHPTFWLDKVCIDQDNIADSLRVLPVNVMACNRVLVLCGPTYHLRLWCIWELFTLLALTARTGEAMKHLWFAPLQDEHADDSKRMTTMLQRFDVAQAQCYDPNEQASLMRVINALGQDRFNERVHELGDACRKNPSIWSFAGSITFAGSMTKTANSAVRLVAKLASSEPKPAGHGSDKEEAGEERAHTGAEHRDQERGAHDEHAILTVDDILKFIVDNSESHVFEDVAMHIVKDLRNVASESCEVPQENSIEAEQVVPDVVKDSSEDAGDKDIGVETSWIRVVEVQGTPATSMCSCTCPG